MKITKRGKKRLKQYFLVYTIILLVFTIAIIFVDQNLDFIIYFPIFYIFFILYVVFLFFIKVCDKLGVPVNRSSLDKYFKEGPIEDICIIFYAKKLFKRKKKVIKTNKNKVKKTQNKIVENVSETNYIADELLKLNELKEKGILTEEEFTEQKKKLL